MHLTSPARRRLATLALVIAGLGIALGLALYGLRGNVTFFYSPSDIKGQAATYTMPERRFRLGGLVKEDSIAHKGKQVHFTVTDGAQSIRVVYQGIPPDLFREGQGVIATGRMVENDIFKARRLLARHDEDYMPPEIESALKRTDSSNTKPDPE